MLDSSKEEGEIETFVDEDLFIVAGSYAENGKNVTRRLQEAISVYLEVLDQSFLEKLSFTWSIVRYNNSAMDLEFHFDNPEYVSQGLTLDFIVVELKDSEIFRDTAGNYVESGTKVKQQILPQSTKEVR